MMADEGRTDVQVGVIVETCGLHIGGVLQIDHESGDMTVLSMFDGKEYGCDVFHCGISVQNSKQIDQKMKLYREGGMDAIKKLWDERVAAGTY